MGEDHKERFHCSGTNKETEGGEYGNSGRRIGRMSQWGIVV